MWCAVSLASEVILMAVEILGMAEAARRLGVTTREVVQMVYDRRIAYVLVDGIPRIPDDAVEGRGDSSDIC